VRAISAPFKRPETRTLIPLQPKRRRRIDGLAHRPSERHALFKLQRDGFGHQLRVQFRFVNFLNIE